MRKCDVNAALIEETDERKVSARCRLDVMDRASGLAGLEEDAVRIVAERERAGDVVGKIGGRDEPRARPATESHRA